MALCSPLRCAALSAVSILVVLGGSRARADEDADMAAARELGVEGVKLADAGNCVDAIDRLTRAERIHHAPTTADRLGECQIAVGKLVDGTETLRKVVREVLAPNAPAAFLAAQDRAKKALDAAKSRIAQLKIAVAAPPNAQFTVKIDGEVVPPANLNVNRPTDPGEHVVDASGPGLLPATAKVKLDEGASDSVALTLAADPNAPPPPPAGTPPATTPPTATPPAPPPAEQPASPPNHTASYVAFGIGGAGLVVGTIFGILALSDKGSLDTNCQNKVCPTTQQDALDSAKTKGNAATVGFVVAGVGAALGVTLYLTSASGHAGASTGSRGPYVRPYVSVGGAGLTGGF